MKKKEKKKEKKNFILVSSKLNKISTTVRLLLLNPIFIFVYITHIFHCNGAYPIPFCLAFFWAFL